MKKRLLTVVLTLLLIAGHSYAQLAYNTHVSSATHSGLATHKNLAGSKNKKSKNKVTVKYLDITNVPDSISKKAAIASQKLTKLFLATLSKPHDSTYTMHSWTSYQSKVIGGSAQVLLDISCAVSHNKNARKAPATRYTIVYQADLNIFKLTYDSYKKTAKVIYNESHWPGFLHSDKTPTKADLDRDISFMLNHIISDEFTLH
ncbi:MAG: hypothetical protein JSS82_19680 [Bacteroidetes bacterium]|nr:hypothetical protein [Bacteroidota bacterium]